VVSEAARPTPCSVQFKTVSKERLQTILHHEEGIQLKLQPNGDLVQDKNWILWSARTLQFSDAYPFPDRHPWVSALNKFENSLYIN
jgi:hypothetical protein